MHDPGSVRSKLSRNGYSIELSSVSADVVASVKDDLTMVPLNLMNPMQQPGSRVSYPLYRENATKLYVPIAYGLGRFGPPTKGSVLDDGEPMSEEARTFKGAMRAEQLAPAQSFLKVGRGILSLPCGSGKTVIALHLVATLGRKTLIVVHKDFLLQQWKERIAEFLPHASVGIIKAKIVDVAGKDIVIASLQSLAIKDYDPGLFLCFGTLVVDECHRIGTECFSQVLHKVIMRYTLGLSATVKRKDGCTKAFTCSLGDVLHSVKRRKDTVTAVQLEFWDSDPRYHREELVYGGKPNMSRMINNVCSWAPRVTLIVDSIASILKNEPDRKVLVLSDRKTLLASIQLGVNAALGDVHSCGMYVGGMKADALTASASRRVVLATFSFASEGFDVAAMDTLVLASPKTDIEQSVGRILRTREAERVRTPIILDIVDVFSIFERQAAKRRVFYKKHGYRIVTSLQEGIGSGPRDDAVSDGDQQPPAAGLERFSFVDL